MIREPCRSEPRSSSNPITRTLKAHAATGVRFFHCCDLRRRCGNELATEEFVPKIGIYTGVSSLLKYPSRESRERKQPAPPGVGGVSKMSQARMGRKKRLRWSPDLPPFLTFSTRPCDT